MADYTRLTDLALDGALTVGGAMTAAGALTVTGKVTANDLKVGTVTGSLATESEGNVTVSDTKALVFQFKLTAASKTVTLGLSEGQIAFVANTGGTNAFTLKNVAGDTGVSVGAGKVALVVASTTADRSTIIVL